jgi:YHS domain-containing protein
MKRLLRSQTAALVLSAIVTECNAVRASDLQASNPNQNRVQNGSDAPAQQGSPTNTEGNTTTRVNVDSQGVILKGCDVVAFFREGKAVKGSSAIESIYQGAKYFFISTADKAEFDKDPAKYAPQYGGFCSYGVANRVLADTDGPDAFAVYKGKLYLCGNEGALKAFKSDISGNIEKADAYWRQLTVR